MKEQCLHLYVFFRVVIAMRESMRLWTTNNLVSLTQNIETIAGTARGERTKSASAPWGMAVFEREERYDMTLAPSTTASGQQQ
jgi:hypothetical protein